MIKDHCKLPETNSLSLNKQLKFNKFRYFALALRIRMLCKSNGAKMFQFFQSIFIFVTDILIERCPSKNYGQKLFCNQKLI